MRAMSIGPGTLRDAVSARLPRDKLARARSLSIVEGAFARVFMACTTGTVLTGFALWLGASPFDIGLLTALPAFAGLAQIAAPYFAERAGQRKPLIMSTVTVQRLLWLPVAIIPFLPLPTAGRVAILLLLVTLSAMLGAIGAVPWLSWMGDIVPKDMRGRYFGARNLVLGAVALIMAPALGLFLDLWKNLPGVAGGYGFVVSFVGGAVAGVVSLWILQRIIEPPMVRGERQSFWTQLRLPWQNEQFRHLILFRGYYIFVVNLAGPFFVVYHLEGLRLSFGVVYLLVALGSLASLVSLRWWGPLCDHWGTRKVMLVSLVGKGLFPLLYIGMGLTATGQPTTLTWVLLILAESFNVAESGLELAANNLQLNIAPRAHNTAYLATYAAVFAVCSAISPLIGGALLSQPGAMHVAIGALDISGYQSVFVISGLLRLSSLVFAWRVHER